MNSKAVLIGTWAGMTAVLLSGCVTFGGRGGLPEHVRSISIPTFKNRTLENGAEEVVTSVVLREFQRDGRLEIQDAQDADALLLGTIVSYSLIPSGYDRDERLTVSRLDATVEVTVIDQTTNVPLLDAERFESSGQFFLTADPSERRERDVLTRLADDIISRLIEGW